MLLTTRSRVSTVPAVVDVAWEGMRVVYWLCAAQSSRL